MCDYYSMSSIIPKQKQQTIPSLRFNMNSYSRLEYPMNRGAWQATDHGITSAGHNLDLKI